MKTVSLITSFILFCFIIYPPAFVSAAFLDDVLKKDLDHYITTKALDGLYHMVGQEEQKIRTNPAARTTDLLVKVFSK